MLCKTRGIVLHAIPYNDKYSIIYMYTEAFGRTSYLVARSRGKKSPVSRALFMPFSVLEMEVEHLNKRDLHRITKDFSQRITQLRLTNPVQVTLIQMLHLHL